MLTIICKKLQIKPLKEFAMKSLPPTSTLRELILSEPDDMPTEEVAVKFKIWKTLLRKEIAQRSFG